MNKNCFGAGIMSPAHSRHLKMIGRGEARRVEIEIEGCGPTQIKEPRLPASLSDPFHPGGNSLCYAIQLAHLMGAGRIVASGFTLRSGSRYQHAGGNPTTRSETAKYGNLKRPLSWLDWYCRGFPGKLCLDVNFEGPLYESLPEAIAPRFKGESDPDREDGQEEPGPR